MRTDRTRTASTRWTPPALTLVRIRAALVLPLVLGLSAYTVAAGAIDHAEPDDVGMSAARLQRVHEAMQRHIDDGNISGGVTAAARRGRLVHLEAHGLMDLESGAPVTADAIFKIMSMTKPVVGVAILMLMEEGKLRLTDPVSRFIPELADLQVAVEQPTGRGRGAGPGAGQAPSFYTIPANRPITIQDLLTHTSGLVSGRVSNSEAARLAPQRPGDRLADVIPRLGQVPLEFQPGDRWSYSAARGFDTLLHIVEIASGQSADRFLSDRLFEPLQMKDTFFWAPETHRARVVTLYQRTPEGLRRAENQTGVTSDTYFSGGGGLMSTAEDYLQFGQMLLNGGELNGVRLLSPKTVELMSSTAVHEFGGPDSGRTFGLSVQIVSDPIAAGYRVGAGSFGWDGAYGTHFWVDPTEDLVGLVMIQTPNFQISRDVENALMQAIVD